MSLWSTHTAGLVTAWLVAAMWTVRTVPAVVGLRRVPDLTKLPSASEPAGMPSLSVIVPAKDEAASIEATLRSLALQDYARVCVVAVNDRSVDGTGERMEAVAAEFPDRVRTMHLSDLPAGWAGKVYAMTRGAEGEGSDYLLFTDGDVYFRGDALRRALTVAVANRVDHLVCLPTLRVKRWDEGVILAVFHVLGSLAVRTWKVPDRKAKRDAVGVGAFNLVRREAFEQIGGFAARPMEIVEDLRLGQVMKEKGMRSLAVFGPGLVEVHWAAGALGIVRTVTKNFFAVLLFRLPLVVLSTVFVMAIFWVPVAGLMWPFLWVPSLLSVAMMALAFGLSGPRTGVSAWYGLLSPVGALGVAGALLWSALTTLRQGGIVWRGTFYPLRTLRREREGAGGLF